MQWDSLLSRSSVRSQHGVHHDETLMAQVLAMRILAHCTPAEASGFRNLDALLAWVGRNPEEMDMYQSYTESIQTLCDEWWQQAPKRHGSVELPLVRICRKLASLLALNQVECDLLVFLWLKLRHEPLRDLHDSLSINDSARHIAVLADLIGHPPHQISAALQPTGRLVSYGLLERASKHFSGYETLPPGSLVHRVAPLLLRAEYDDLCSSDLADALLQLCPRQPSGCWPLRDFPQVPQRQWLLSYLRRALKQRRRGANVLIHGRPGVGKTELARTLAHSLAVELFAVPSQNDELHPIEPQERLGRYRLAQQLIAGRQDALLLFDEVEDAMAGGVFLPKAWTNQILEENPVPALWLSNSIGWLDPAFLRRFDLIIEVGPGNEAVHARLQQQLESLPILPPVRTRLARQSWMTPALANQLVDLAQLLPRKSPLRNQQHLKELLSSRLTAIGQTPAILEQVFGQAADETSENAMPDYRIDWLNTHPTLDQLVQRLRRRHRGRLCLYGPPGTGKTALATHLATMLDRPLVAVSASSLQSRYVGGTEQRIRETFAKAWKSRAVLLLDEVDSLLMARESAHFQWEVSHTNELLVQIESYPGILLATTNRVDSLDRAVMRRFDLKVAFDYLTAAQLRSLLRTVLPEREGSALDALPDAELARRNLAPGNVRTALDQLQLRGAPLRLATLLSALDIEEQQQGGPGMRSIGFL